MLIAFNVSKILKHQKDEQLTAKTDRPNAQNSEPINASSSRLEFLSLMNDA